MKSELSNLFAWIFSSKEKVFLFRNIYFIPEKICVHVWSIQYSGQPCSKRLPVHLNNWSENLCFIWWIVCTLNWMKIIILNRPTNSLLGAGNYFYYLSRFIFSSWRLTFQIRLRWSKNGFYYLLLFIQTHFYSIWI